jgi:hypothetical protein
MLTYRWIDFFFSEVFNVEKTLSIFWKWGSTLLTLKNWSPCFLSEYAKSGDYTSLGLTFGVIVGLCTLKVLKEIGNAIRVFYEVDLSLWDSRSIAIAHILVGIDIFEAFVDTMTLEKKRI